MQYILKNIRKIKYLMKILLDKDQRRLLQLKQTEYISSDLDEYDPNDYKKHLLKNEMVNLYIDNLRSKKLKRSDIKLLEITGFKKVIDLLNKQRSVERVQKEWNQKDDEEQSSYAYHQATYKRVERGTRVGNHVPNAYLNTTSYPQVDQTMSLSMSPKRISSAGYVRGPFG